ncbi:C-C motif chemokine 24-like [Ochotona curzoniae]|uniref:C-C motif chemokine 24-like n=1 Tax=Ochotona curzoniae TaxID=130825 RepID=UPI001B346E60|nr:C-C motif chemokine 24-like [Ochotona curzoniae]XP_040853663.1 C-C motif chemokine 24-like [Ochotona curzoniae]
MAGPATIAASLLLLAFAAGHICRTGSVVIPVSCCMSFATTKIPRSRVVGYQLSNGSMCPRAGVIFLTKKGLKLCGDPRQPWVQSYIKNLDAKRKKSSKRARMKDLRVPGQTPAGGSPTI